MNLAARTLAAFIFLFAPFSVNSARMPRQRAAAAPRAVQTEDWRRYKNDGGNFSVLLPVEPQESVGEQQNEEMSPTHTIRATSGSITYMIVYAIMKPEQPVDEATFKMYRDVFLDSLGDCTVATEAPASPAVRGYVGHSYRIKCDDDSGGLILSGNLYWGKHYAYVVMARFAAAASDPPAVRKFSDSFFVLDTGSDDRV